MPHAAPLLTRATVVAILIASLRLCAASPGSGAAPLSRILLVQPDHPAARDENDGRAERPFRTIAGAARAAAAGDTVRIAPGIYREAVLLERGGQPGAPITFEAVESGRVIVSGADVLKQWRRQPGDRPIYTTAWARDFIARPTLRGVEARMRGSQQPIAPVHCAEMFIHAGRPLRQVLDGGDLAPGKFFVDWDADTVSVWLPDSGDPNASLVEGATRQTLFAAREDGGAAHIALKGLVFRHGATWAQQALVVCGAHWHLEDCVFEWANGRGLTIRDGARVIRCVGQDNGQMGFGGGGRDILVRDCTLRRNNWKGYNVSWEAGGCKFVRVEGMRLEKMTSYQNTGHGIWFDIDNRDFVITGCTAYGNRGLDRDHQGSGIFVEISPGPGVIENNTCYGNTGSGLKLAESTHLTVWNNLLVGNGAGVEFRNMTVRGYAFGDIRVENNRIKASRIAAFRTEGTNWDPAHIAAHRLAIDGNTYDLTGEPVAVWGKAPYRTLAEVRRGLGVEHRGREAPVTFEQPFVAASSRRTAAASNIATAVTGRMPGQVVTLPVFGRAADRGSTAITGYDLNGTHVTLHVGAGDLLDGIRRRVPPFPGDTPTWISARLRAAPAGAIEADVLGISDASR